MFRIRESSREDADPIFALAAHLDTVNLPAEPGAIARILVRSQASFAGDIAPEQREYVFVLEEVESGRVVGTSMIHAQHGTRRAPHIYFQILREERYSSTLDRYFVHQCLRLGYNYNGPTEIGGLILLPEFRGRPESLGKLLSYVRFLFIAMRREAFRDRVLSELLPPLEADGTSVLWEHLGKKFTGLTYQEADLLSKDNKEFIRALFPHELIYVQLLPEEVKRVIGKVGPKTLGVETMLRAIGFEFANQIDPFDGGPHFVANTDEVTLVKGARRRQVEVVRSADGGRPWGILAPDRPGFRAVGARFIPEAGSGAIGLTEETCRLLDMEQGDTAWLVAP